MCRRGMADNGTRTWQQTLPNPNPPPADFSRSRPPSCEQPRPPTPPTCPPPTRPAVAAEKGVEPWWDAPAPPGAPAPSSEPASEEPRPEPKVLNYADFGKSQAIPTETQPPATAESAEAVGEPEDEIPMVE